MSEIWKRISSSWDRFRPFSAANGAERRGLPIRSTAEERVQNRENLDKIFAGVLAGMLPKTC